ncbi:RNA polymerase factor sigma-54 [Litchfieldia alkalitelluris]|uniref:RNA polymerase factor sigma-54 n=1 Tax=Litchfieldia alkalitelluris TaxID=304268 RepID=UPI000997626B|nr:RNA polymerase factor sigma-54 [Litchfieldia alkalitelluris]
MDFKTGLFQQQTLRLVMTKELTQAISLLQYSSLELSEFLQEQSIENPLIDLKEYSNYAYSKGKQSQTITNPIDYLVLENKSLAQHLKDQMIEYKLSEEDQPVIEYLIDSLDENGYFLFDKKDIAKQIGVTQEKIDLCLELVQQFEPAGVGAQSLQECLLLQIKRLNINHWLINRVLNEHFEKFAKKSWKDIAKELKVNLKDIQEVHDFVHTLNPRPGSNFNCEEARYIKPDVKIEIEQGEVLISLIDDYSSRLSLNSQYYKLRDLSSETKSFLEEKYNQYLWIVRSIEQRKQTLLNVMTEIAKRQESFFKGQTNYLEPLTMSEVANQLAIHESTVSRAARDKYVQTPFGTIEIRSFFTNQVNQKSDEDVSSAQVKKLISDIINHENKKKPYSDQQIVSILEDNSQIFISRRTVAKYREQLGIVGSSKRKRY